MHADGVARADAVRGAVERDQQLVENSEAMALSAAVLAVAGELTRRIHEGVVARGSRAAARARLRLHPARPGRRDRHHLAAHLGVTVDELVRKGTPSAARTPRTRGRGWSCSPRRGGPVPGGRGAAEAVHVWSETLGESEVRALGAQLLRIAPNGAIRPAWRALIRSRRVVAGHRRNFYRPVTSRLSLLARNLMSEQHPVIRITGRRTPPFPLSRKEITRCCPGSG